MNILRFLSYFAKILSVNRVKSSISQNLFLKMYSSSMAFETEYISRPNLGTSADVPDVPSRTYMPSISRVKMFSILPFIFIILFAAKTQAQLQLPYKLPNKSDNGHWVITVICPDDENLRKIITKRNPKENYVVRCKTPLGKS